MNVPEAAKVIGYLGNCYPAVSIPDTMPAVWSDVFADVAGEDVMTAAKAYVRTGAKFFPSVGELFEILQASDVISSITPGEVWREIRQQIGSVGTNGRPQLSPIAKAVVDGLGGWRVMCQSYEDDNLKRLPRVLEMAKQTVRRQEQLQLAKIGNGKIVMLEDGDENL